MRLMFGVYIAVRMYASYNIPMYVRSTVVGVCTLISRITVPTSDVYVLKFIVKHCFDGISFPRVSNCINRPIYVLGYPRHALFQFVMCVHVHISVAVICQSSTVVVCVAVSYVARVAPSVLKSVRPRLRCIIWVIAPAVAVHCAAHITHGNCYLWR